MMRARFYALLLVAATAVAVTDSEVTLKALPGCYAGARRDYKVDPYIRAAMSLQSLGKDKACAKLLALANTKGIELDIDGNEKIVILCRMLFTAKAGGEFRRPWIGGAAFLGSTGYSDWPLEPIELVDGVPFLITRGYFLGGEPEPGDSYLRYCMTNCDWSSYQWRIPTVEEKRTALATLLASRKWKKPLTGEERGFLVPQIEDAK